jgi:hypothetical protein
MGWLPTWVLQLFRLQRARQHRPAPAADIADSNPLGI